MKTVNQLLSREKDILNWLDLMRVSNYKLVAHKRYGFVVDVKEGVGLVAKNLKLIPVKFRHVNGYFDCGDNQLKSLMGCPGVVTGDFLCDFNALTSLEHAPQTIKGKFDCCHNNLVSLKGCAKDLGGAFLCYHNSLTSLEHGPETVNGVFNCSYNLLTNLDFIPKRTGVGNLFVCEKNEALGDLQDIDDFDKIREIQDIVNKAKKERLDLSKIIEVNTNTTDVVKTYKI